MSDAETVVRPLEPPLPDWAFEYVVNPLMRTILRSPLHGLVSDWLLAITYTGRKSGDEYTVPVAYECQGETLYVTSHTYNVWWTNLRGGAPVAVWLRGERREGEATLVEDDDAVAEYVLDFIDRHGIESVDRLALEIDHEGDGLPSREALAARLSETVVVEIALEEG